ncbi:PREDICTED: uncharacterized protein LOC104773177 [Camelina sativa]|uniref:Uncharacterized protein LOC104773177 n=1 Tax=Camelina sativa TaxID=90675 RepID=A0ABM0Y5Z7_CAMSA|nr:PREDICTED: uncharacterized protein LOC104773177 [Camelina sativa]
MVKSSEHPHDVEITEPYDAEIRVERNVASFLDEDPNFDYHDIPPNSDDEGGGEKFVRLKKGSGQLQFKQVFDTLEDFKECLIDYALKGGYNIKLDRWGKEKNGAVCSMDGCHWRCYYSFHNPIGKWVLKTFEDDHNCTPDGYCRLLKSAVVAKMFMDEIRSNLDYSPKAIQYEVQKRFNIMITPDVCKKAKKKVLDMIHRDHIEQFSRLRDYKDAILETNPNSTVELDTIIGDDGSELFRRFYVCFDVFRKLWPMWCRPIFGIEGCFIKSTFKGQLLAAVGRDANNGLYPIAWAVVDVEDEENSTWFLSHLKDHFHLQEGQGFTVISNRQKGLLNAVNRVLPYVEHRMCARHIYGNLKGAFPNQNEVKTLFWRVAESYTVAEYEANLQNARNYDIRLYDAIMQRNPRNCSLAFCSPTAKCVDVHNNISESFNNAIDPARYVPMVEMLETIGRRTMVRFDLRKTAASQYTGRITERAKEILEEEAKYIKYCSFFPGADGRYDVRESGINHSVNLRLRTCVCRRWDMSGIPCRHARVITEKKLNREDYISDWYLNSRQLCIYSNSVAPVNGMLFWHRTGSVVVPPAALVEQIENRKGKKPKLKREKARHESPTKKKKKISRENRIMHCSLCNYPRHNKLRCPNAGVERYQPPRKPRKKKQSSNATQGAEGSQVAIRTFEVCTDMKWPFSRYPRHLSRNIWLILDMFMYI